MKPRLRVLVPVVALVLVLTTVALATGFLFWAPLPTIDGTYRLLGLRERGEIIRDADGVPHVYAQNTRDAFYLQGYVTAQDRLFQMDLFRRVGRGELSAVLGADALETDKFVRTIGLHRAARSDLDLLGEETRAALDAYAEGVNKFLEQSLRGALPIEFTILGYRPHHWNVIDSLLLGRIQALDLATNYESELLRASAALRLGEGALPRLFPDPPAAAAAVGPAWDAVRDRLSPAAASGRAGLRELLGDSRGAGGSNCFALAGSRTESGGPLLAGDPHLAVGNPSIWYEIGLEAPGLKVVGFSIPGTPGVVIGHNERIAWSFTSAYIDTQDLYVERADPDDPRRFLFQGGYEPATVIRERIAIRGSREPVHFDVVITRHGPILTPVLDAQEAPLALRWTAHEPGRTFDAIFEVNRARSWEEFRAALVEFQGPPQTACYADVDGHVGWVLAGHVPLRAPGHDGTLPVPGWTGELEWRGTLAAAQRHAVLDPADGIVISANQRLVVDPADPANRGEWDAGFRARRLAQLLPPLAAATVDDLARVQSDTRSLAAAELREAILSARPETERGRAAQALVRAWDGTLEESSAAAAVYAAWIVAVAERVFGDKLGEALYAEYAAYARFVVPALLALVARPDDPWFSELGDPDVLGRDAVAGRALDDAASALERRLGPDMATWRWGDVHLISFAHPLSVAPLDLVLEIGPFGRPGDGQTIDVGAYRLLRPFEIRAHASMRMIVDLADLERSRSILPTGQSGQPFSKYWGDQTRRWLAGEHHAMRFSRDALGRPDGHLVFRAR